MRVPILLPSLLEHTLESDSSWRQMQVSSFKLILCLMFWLLIEHKIDRALIVFVVFWIYFHLELRSWRLSGYRWNVRLDKRWSEFITYGRSDSARIERMFLVIIWIAICVRVKHLIVFRTLYTFARLLKVSNLTFIKDFRAKLFSLPIVVL